MRESPAIDIIKIHDRCAAASVKAFDPVAMDEANHCLDGIEYAGDEYRSDQRAPTLS